MKFTNADVMGLIEKEQLNLKSVKNKGLTARRILKAMESEAGDQETVSKDDYAKYFNRAVLKLRNEKQGHISDNTVKKVTQILDTAGAKKAALVVDDDKPLILKRRAKTVKIVEPVVAAKPAEPAPKITTKTPGPYKPPAVEAKPAEPAKKTRKPNPWLDLVKKTRSEMPKGATLKEIISTAKKDYKPEKVAKVAAK